MKCNKISSADKKYICTNLIILFVMFFVSTICTYVYEKGCLPRIDYGIWFCLVSIVLAYLVNLLWILAIKYNFKKRIRKVILYDEKKSGNWKFFFLYLGIFLLIWGCSFLAYYPGITAYDCYEQICYVAEGEYSTHHPLLHTVFLGYSWKVGMLYFHSGTKGIAIATIVQISIMSFAFSYVMMLLLQKGLKRWVTVLLSIIAAVYPLNIYFCVSHTKDVLFSVFFFLVIVLILEIEKEMPRKEKAIKALVLCIALTLTIMLRNNGIYCAIAVLFLCIIKNIKTKKTITTFTILCAIIIALTGQNIMQLKSEASSGDAREKFSLPIQQVSRTLYYHEENIDPLLIENANLFFEDEAYQYYKPLLADPVKGKFNSEAVFKNPDVFIDLYLRLLKEYPEEYVVATLLLYGGYWNLYDESIMYVYDNGDWLHTIWTYFPTWYLQGFDIQWESKLPELKSVLEYISTSEVLFDTPVLKTLFLPSTFFWSFIFLCNYCINRKEKELYLPTLYIVVLYLTCFLGPCVLIRYAYPITLSLPYLILYLFCKNDKV